MFAACAAAEAAVVHGRLRREYWPHAPLRAAPAEVQLVRGGRSDIEGHRGLLYVGAMQERRELR